MKQHTQKQLNFINKHRLRVDKNGIVQVPKMMLTFGFGKLLKDENIEYECYDCKYKK